MSAGALPTILATFPATLGPTMNDPDKSHSPRRGPADSKRGDPGAADKRRREVRRKERLDDQLDAGLEGTFPGSDPVAVTQPPHSPYDGRKP
jgi:hypothetical protein